jgi:hypothetical protein
MRAERRDVMAGSWGGALRWREIDRSLQSTRIRCVYKCMGIARAKVI